MKKIAFVAAFGAIALAASLSPAAAQSQDCGGEYVIRPGDYLSKIASRTLDDASKWTWIHNQNIKIIGDNPHLIHPDVAIRIPCTEVSSEGGGGGPTPPPVTDAAKVTLLTGSDYAPFTQHDMDSGGLVTHIVAAAFAATGPADDAEPDYGIDWINDWSAHLHPLLAEGKYDMGFPWFQPDCANEPDRMRCRDFDFSEPMFEMLILLFASQERPIGFQQDDDLVGRTLCRPAGYFTHDLDKDGRNWLRDGKITLKQPQTVAECFRMLLDGEVDVVAINEFTGRTAVHEGGLSDKVTIVDRPLSIEGLHVLVAKTHPQARALIARVNNGLELLQKSGEYNRIVDQHLARFWAQLEG